MKMKIPTCTNDDWEHNISVTIIMLNNKNKLYTRASFFSCNISTKHSINLATTVHYVNVARKVDYEE